MGSAKIAWMGVRGMRFELNLIFNILRLLLAFCSPVFMTSDRGRFVKPVPQKYRTKFIMHDGRL